MASTSKNSGDKTTPKSSAGTENKGHELDVIRKNLAKRSFHVKFDLADTGYQPIEKIGIGAYGVVCSAIHKKSSDRVAIKKIPFVFDSLAIAKRTYREIKILKHFKHDNIISIREILKPKESYHDFKDIYVVFDLMESDLHRIIYSEQPLTEEHIRYFLYQILRGLKYIHSANVVHRDLKPSNLLVNEDCHVRIGDFGMARGVNSQPEEPSHYMTQYVATRWYRAPEILLSLLEYGTAVDMWSVGCIFAEMLGRKHLFPGKDYLMQVKLVLGLLGTPSEAVLKNCQSDVLRRIIKSLGHRQPMAWTTLFPKASKKALDLLGKMLVMNPAERITVDRALKHPFLSKYHDPDDEPICVPSFEFDFEKELLHMDSEQLREVIYKEIMEFHQPRTPTLSFLACLRPVPRAEEASEGGEEGGSTEAPSFKDQLKAMMSKAAVKVEGGGKEDGSLPSVSALPTAPESSASPAQEVAVSQSLSHMPSSQQPEEVFKKPVDKPATKKSPVLVDTANLQLPCTSDVEMLSAQSSDGSKAMDTQITHPLISEKQKEREKETKAGEKKENKTISEDTKALVKQALLSHRQRTESCGDDDKPRPVTAAQRQREREERRKKKRDNKMKKMQEKKKEAPKTVELSDADKELLARWSSMQKKTEPSPAQTTTTMSQSPSTATIVYLHQGNPATPSPPQGTPGLSPSHPAPTSTPPTILPAGIIQQGQVTLMTGQLAMTQGQISTPHTQIIIPHGSLPQSQVDLGLQGQTTPQQGHAVLPQQHPGSQPSLPDGNVISFVDLQRHSGGQLQITQTQAEALKEVLNMSQGNLAGDRRSSGGGEAVNPRPVRTPPQASGREAGDFSPSPDSTNSPHRNTTSPAHSQQVSHHAPAFTPPDPCRQTNDVFNMPTVGQSQSYQPSMTQAVNGTNSSEHPQTLAEFLERHCQSPEQTDPLTTNAGTAASFQSTDVKMNSFGNSTAGSHAAQDGALAKGEQNPFVACGFFQGSQIKPAVDFSDKPLVNQQIQGSLQLNTSANITSSQTFQTAVYPAIASTSNTCFSMQNQPGMGPLPAVAPPYFLPSNTGMDYGHAGHLLHSTPAQGSVENPGHVALPFSQYTEATTDFHVSGSGEGSVSGTFGVGPHAGLTHDVMGSHSNLAPAAVGSHPGFGSVSMGNCSNLVQASLKPQQAVDTSGQGACRVPSNSFSHQPTFQTPMLMQAPHSVVHQHPPSQHQHLPQNQHQTMAASHLQPQPNLQPAASHTHTERRGPDLRVSAPKQDGVDLVAMLSNKLSSIFPPSLSLTPRGTGAGYGVGLDLDVLMADAAADGTNRGAELSPLSCSLLSDWLDVAGNISQADLDALEQDFGMTSPMAMSYSDFNTSNSNNNDNTSWE